MCTVPGAVHAYHILVGEDGYIPRRGELVCVDEVDRHSPNYLVLEGRSVPMFARSGRSVLGLYAVDWQPRQSLLCAGIVLLRVVVAGLGAYRTDREDLLPGDLVYQEDGRCIGTHIEYGEPGYSMVHLNPVLCQSANVEAATVEADW